jgi:hypothetical protein
MRHYFTFMGSYWSVANEDLFKDLQTEVEKSGCVPNVTAYPYCAREIKGKRPKIPFDRFHGEIEPEHKRVRE